MRTRTVLLVGALTALCACGQSTTPTTPSQPVSGTPSPSGAASVTVSIASPESFDPNAATISPGMEVNWINDDSAGHVLVADDGSWSSGNLDSEATFTHAFPNAGTFRYHDAAHPEVAGTVVVK